MKLILSLILMISTQALLASPELGYSVLQKDSNIELRQYDSYLTASVSFVSEEELEERGFDILADYIFGNNISMTSPVFTAGENIGMTSPVFTDIQKEKWTMTFVMPERYTIETLPKPSNESIVINEVEPKLMATIRFNGLRTQERTAIFEKQLRAWIAQEGLEILGGTIYAGHNPPWTPPVLKRNEVLFEVVR